MRKLLITFSIILLAFSVWLFPATQNTTGTVGTATASGSATDLTSNWTISTWVYPTTVPGFQSWFSRGAANMASGRQIQLLDNGAGKVRVNIPYIAVILDGGTPLTVNTWHSVIVTRSGNTWTIYLNGTSDGSTSNATAQESGGPVVIGNQPSLNAFTVFQGRIAEIAGWSAVLSSDEIKALAHGTPPNRIRRISLAYYWPLHTKNAGNVWAELSGGGWNATDVSALNIANHAPMSPPGGAN